MSEIWMDSPVERIRQFHGGAEAFIPIFGQGAIQYTLLKEKARESAGEVR